jgi:long-chain acyl-CoA synthetase
MVVGQDQRYLAAIIVPREEAIKHYYQEVKKTDISHLSLPDLAGSQEVHDLIMHDINERINLKKGFKIFERINKIFLSPQPFLESRELTHSLKLRRDVIYALYAQEIEKLYQK